MGHVSLAKAGYVTTATLAPPPSAIRTGPVGTPEPSRSLGWGMFEWAGRWLCQPDGPQAGEPWNFTNEQARFLLWWYAFDESLRFIYRSGVYRRMKGAGKNPFAAAISAIELLGPCRPTTRLDDRGYAIGEPQYSSWVQTAAVTREQTKNAMTLMPALLSKGAIEEYGVDMGKEIIYANRGRCRMESVTSSPRALEGGRPTFIVCDETHWWLLNNEGHAMADVIARNAAKSRDGAARRLAITNAHAPGQDSVAERDYEAWQKIEQGLAPADMLYDCLEAPDGIELSDDESVRNGIAAARGDSDWLDPQRILAEIRDPRTSVAVTYRFYLNKIHAEEDKPFDKAKFAELARPGYVVAKGALITLGFDGSLVRDHTALIATEVESGYQWVAGHWEPEQMGGEITIDFAAVDQTVDHVFEEYDVWRMYADPYKWGTYLAKWAGKYGDKVVSWPTTNYKKMAHAVAAYRVAIEGGDLSHDGDRRLVAAVGNAHKHMLNIRDDDGELMYVIQKERPDSPLKIDPAVAAVLSWQTAQDAIATGALDAAEIGVTFVRV